MKKLVNKTFGNSSLSYEKFYTILCDCESVFNYLSQAYISNCAIDVIPLKPSKLTDIKESNTSDLDKIDHSEFDQRLRYRQK